MIEREWRHWSQLKDDCSRLNVGEKKILVKTNQEKKEHKNHKSLTGIILWIWVLPLPEVRMCREENGLGVSGS